MRQKSFLDRPAARFLSATVVILCLAVLAYIHRDDLLPAAAQKTTAATDPFTRCFSESAGKIDKMLAEGSIRDAQAQLFRTRAEARCRAQTQKHGINPTRAPRR